MKLQVLQENLKNAVNLTSHFVSVKAQLPILSNILLKTDKTRLVLSSTNLETSVSVSLAAKVEEEGEITINGKVFNDLISNLNSGTVELESFKEQMKITSGTFKSNILVSNSSDFPKLPSSLGKNVIKIKREDFLNSLSKVLFSVSLDETRPILTGVLFVFSEDTLKLVSTDGFRLTEIKIKNENKITDNKILIPKSVLYELTKLNTEGEIEFSFEKENNQVIFSVGDIILSSRIIEGEFPDYEKIIPTSSACILNLDKEDLEKSIKLASVFARDSGNTIKLKIEGENLKISAESSTSGNQETNLEIRRTDEEKKDIEIIFNYKFIEDFLKVVESDEIQIQISDNNKASKFLDPKLPNLLHIIMPIKTS